MAEGDTGESRPKRQRTNDLDRFNILKDFLDDKDKLDILEEAYISLKNGLSQMNVCMIKIEETNARLSEGFSRASCSTSVYKTEAKTSKTFAIGHIFRGGLFVLKEFIDETNPGVPVDVAHQEALIKLLNFLSMDHSALLEHKNLDEDLHENRNEDENVKDAAFTEGKWALKIAQHLLCPLSPSDGYIIDDCYQKLTTYKTNCPCKEHDELFGGFGNTTFGCVDGWHGKNDIFVNDLVIGCTRSLFEDLDDASSNMSNLSSATEVKGTTSFNEKDIQQIIAQTIVFSFLQRKENKGIQNINNSLVPFVGISDESIIVYFYDCEGDVLLGTIPLGLYADSSPSKLSHNTIVFLWLTLNYKLFCSGITDEMKPFKASFFDRVGDKLYIYRDKVIRPCPIQHKKESKDAFKWATNRGIKVDIIDGSCGIKIKKIGR